MDISELTDELLDHLERVVVSLSRGARRPSGPLTSLAPLTSPVSASAGLSGLPHSPRLSPGSATASGRHAVRILRSLEPQRITRGIAWYA